MKKYVSIIFILITSLITAQSDYQLLIKGSLEDAVINPVYSPDGSKLAFTKNNYQGIWIYEFQTQTTYQITDEFAAGYAFKWSADSKSILSRVAKYEDLKRLNAVKVFNVETKVSKQISDYNTMMPYLPLWADGDSRICLPVKGDDEVYISGKEKNNSISNRIIAFEKNNKIVIKDITNNSEQAFEPIKDAQYINLSASPNGSKLVFEVLSGNLFTMNIDGTNLIDLGKGNRPRWSFDIC